MCLLGLKGGKQNFYVAVECFDIKWNSRGEGGLPIKTVAETRKCGELTGLDTLVVHTVNYEYKNGGAFKPYY